MVNLPKITGFFPTPYQGVRQCDTSQNRSQANQSEKEHMSISNARLCPLACSPSQDTFVLHSIPIKSGPSLLLFSSVDTLREGQLRSRDVLPSAWDRSVLITALVPRQFAAARV